MQKRVLAVITALALLTPIAAWSKTGNTTSDKVSATGSKSVTTTKKRTRMRSRKSWRKRGQQQIAVDRNREIQAALIREGYLGGKPSGQMDAATKAALMRYQKDNGWQSSRIPDSRALIKLGLGPNHELLNPETAAVANLQSTPAQSLTSAK